MIKPASIFRRSALFVALILAPLVTAQATLSDVDKERRWAEQVIEGLLDGDELWLTDPDGHRFFNLFTEGDSDSGRAVVLIHGIGVHPNWPDVIYPLRAGLLEQGVSTLSVQMPILPNDAGTDAYRPLFAEVPGRLDAVLDWLRDAGYHDIVLVAHSLGASMTSHYLARNEPAAVSSVILIGMGPGFDGRQNIDNLAKIGMPVLDLYGDSDLEGVLASAERRAAAGAGNQRADYRQVVGTGADHFWQGEEKLLLDLVDNWLRRAGW